MLVLESEMKAVRKTIDEIEVCAYEILVGRFAVLIPPRSGASLSHGLLVKDACWHSLLS